MPELPEVETIRRELGPQLAGRRVADAWSHESDKFTPALDVTGTTFGEVSRRGKYLLAALDNETELVIHLGMTGVLRVIEPDDESGFADLPHIRARWTFADGGQLVFRDVRRFGRLRVVPNGDYSTITTLFALGPEPFDPAFTAEHLHRELNASSRRIKTQLLSQRPVAGVGNIYADEALWHAQVYPAARRITRPAAERLRDAIEDVLAAGVANGGTTLRDYRTATGAEGSNQHHLVCYGRAGLPCERCAKTLVARSWDARTTTFCPVCQKR